MKNNSKLHEIEARLKADIVYVYKQIQKFRAKHRALLSELKELNKDLMSGDNKAALTDLINDFAKKSESSKRRTPANKKEKLEKGENRKK